MSGGGGGGAFVHRSPAELRDQVRKVEEKTTIAAFEAELSRMLGELLGAYNGRDIDTLRDRFDELKGARAENGKVAVTTAGTADTGGVVAFYDLPGAGVLIGLQRPDFPENAGLERAASCSSLS